ncbi:MAG: NAD(P)-binding domain-containing protein [Acidobacteria bacterium]|nr:NAD(P)-binding domain-containing protein [Acidobacteriota bacterium]
MPGKLRALVQPVLDSANTPTRRPVLDAHFQSSVPGLYVIGDLAGAPVVKLAMAQGAEVAEHIAGELGGRGEEPLADARGSAPSAGGSGDSVYDLVVVGAGAAGLNAALAAQDLGLRVVVLEKNQIANTIEDFPEGKWVYAEPDTVPPKGKLWLDGARKEDLIGRWRQIIADNRLEVRTQEGVSGIERRRDGVLEITSSRQVYHARRVVLATGQRGNPRKLSVPGEDREHVYHRLYSPKHYHGENILVVGGGNSAVEAALTLAEQNHVTLSYRGTEFSRLFKDNRQRLKAALETNRLAVIFQSQVRRFNDGNCVLEVGGSTRQIPYDHAFVLIGADVPTEFLRSLGIRLENDWTGNPLSAIALVLATLIGIWGIGSGSGLWGGLAAAAAFAGLVISGWRGSRFAWLGVSFLISYTIYGAKQAPGYEFWPYRGWGAKALTLFERPWSFWYTVLYTSVMTVFGIQAMKRWGLDKRDRFQIWRYVSLIGFQWIFFFLIPEFLFRWAVEYKWVGERLASDPSFTQAAWRSYGLIYAWPLFFYTFFGNPHQVWIVWGALLSFVIIPVLVLFHGKRYCSWICGCGGLAETLGDRWRHLAPKGKTAIRWELMNTIVLWAAAAVTVFMLGKDVVTVFRKPAVLGLEYYHLIADVWLVGILPVTLYPFFGGKVWCRYWCPLAKLMHVFSAIYTRLRASRFAIHANDKCIACGECSRNCQVGIDVMQFALKQEELNNLNSSCIGCGICVTVCPMDVLSFQPQVAGQAKLVQIQVAR